jgi:hypothetical protein
MRKAKHAVELAKIQKVQSEINRNNFEGAAAFVNATQHIDNINVFMGSVAIVKRYKGELNIIELSTDQMMFLEDNPQLKNNPQKFLEKYSQTTEEINDSKT